MKKITFFALLFLGLFATSTTFANIRNEKTNVEKYTPAPLLKDTDGVIYVGSFTYISSNFEMLYMRVYTSIYTGSIGSSMQVSVNGDPGYACMYDGMIALGQHSVTFSDVTIMYFGNTNGSFTIPSGTYSYN